MSALVTMKGLQANNKTSLHPGLEEGAGFISRLTFGWFTDLLRIGASKQLAQEDLGRPHPADEGLATYERMQALWDAEVHAHGLKGAKLRRVVYRFVGRNNILFLGVCAYLSAGCQTLMPVLVKRLLQWLEGTTTLGQAEKWLVVLAILVLPLIAAFIQAHVQHVSSRIGLHLYSAMTQILYRKSLRLSAHARNSASTGRLVNLMSNDAGTSMEQALRVVAPTLTAFPQLIVVVTLLILEVELAMFAGVAFAFFSVPFAALVFTKVGGFYGLAAHEADERLKITNDLLTGIRVVKAYAWEQAFLRKIGATREKELHFIRKHAYWSMLGMMSVYMQLPALMQFVVYMTFVGMGGEFTASRLFTAIQLFQLLQQPLMQLPSALTQLAQLQSALRRLVAFLRLHELDIHTDDVRVDTLPKLASDEATIQITADAVFTWDPGDVESWRLGLPQSAAEKRQEARKSKSEAAALQRTPRKDDSKETESNGDAPTSDEMLQSVSVQTPSGGVESISERAAANNIGPRGFELKGIGMRIQQGDLVALVGPVGSGKSSLLSAILNEMSKKSGNVTMRGRVAYAAQLPWIQNATLRSNVLFGSPYEEGWYTQVLAACALSEDLKLFEAGDQTEIGERGINLSGGQKARVSLARAVYCRADILLLDDPLAAVDMHVGDTLFEECIRGVLKGKTVVFVTNQLHRLQHVSSVLMLHNGSISESGSYAELKQAGGDFADLLARQGIAGISKEARAQVETTTGTSVIGPGTPAREISSKSSASSIKAGKRGVGQTATLTQEEGRGMGAVSWRVYVWFVQQCGIPLMLAFAFFTSLQCYLPVIGGFVLAMWMEEVRVHGSTKENDFRWLGFYGMLLGGSFLSSIASSIFSAESRVRGARHIHSGLLRTVSRATVGFFDVTPIGRILNRFAKDLLTVDHHVLMMLSWCVVIANFVLSSCVAVIVSTRGWLLILILPVLLMYLQIFKFVRQSAIDIQRLEAVSRSPLASTFQEILMGLSTVRAYKRQSLCQEINTAMMNQNIVPLFLAKTAQPAWLTLRLNCLGALTCGSCAIYAVVVEATGGTQTAGMAGFGITYASMISQMMTISIFIMIQVETMMNSVERIREYMNVEPEAAEIVPNVLRSGEQWPASGRVILQELVIGYRDGPDVLHRISADIAPCEKVGVVGRTGSGKSTIILSVFRLMEPRSGTILIDGVDIVKVGLFQLRSKLGLIPQDPVLFTGTLRYNIDPFSESTDQQVWNALRAVHMNNVVERLPQNLEQLVQEGGDNFSVGERQLLCIARALLRNPRVLFLDEATASVDSDTDAKLQGMIRSLFANKTVVTIAHRLDTIMDSDRIMVMDKGTIAEFDKPLKLLENEDGVFSGLVRAGNADHLHQIAMVGYLEASTRACSADTTIDVTQFIQEVEVADTAHIVEI